MVRKVVQGMEFLLYEKPLKQGPAFFHDLYSLYVGTGVGALAARCEGPDEHPTS
jgi:hypothetical protein